MKPRLAHAYSMFFALLFVCGTVLVVQYITSFTPIDMVRQVLANDNKPIEVTKCSDREPIANLEQTKEWQLAKLYEYQQVCNSYVTDTMMIFIDMPNSFEAAEASAHRFAESLREYNKYNVHPLVIVEPVTSWGLIDFTEFDAGFYDAWIDYYFKALIAEGITGDMIGTWVPFPEANLPYWNRANATPAQFGLVVNRYLRILKTYYPEAKGSVLLNSATYESTDFNWENGEYLSLLPYVSTLDKSLIQSFGIQGFPWRNDASAPKERTVYDAQEFINPPLAIEAANALGVKEIWINTGTFKSKYTSDPDKIVFIDPVIRKEIIDNIAKQAEDIKNLGFDVSVNLFSEDKSFVDEATNWSYWGDYRDLDDPNIYVFKDFAKRLEHAGVKLWLFDSTKLEQGEESANDQL